MKKGDKGEEEDAKATPFAEARGAEYKAEAKGDDGAPASSRDAAVKAAEEALPRALGEDVPAEDLGDYWRGTDGLLRRATAHIYRKIIAPKCEGGFREWFDDRCEAFRGSDPKGEHKPEFFTLYKEFEAMIADALEAFVEDAFDEEGSVAERMRDLNDRIAAAATDDDSKLKHPIDKSLTMLLAAADYKKFCALMRARAKANAAAAAPR